MAHDQMGIGNRDIYVSTRSDPEMHPKKRACFPSFQGSRNYHAAKLKIFWGNGLSVIVSLSRDGRSALPETPGRNNSFCPVIKAETKNNLDELPGNFDILEGQKQRFSILLDEFRMAIHKEGYEKACLNPILEKIKEQHKLLRHSQDSCRAAIDTILEKEPSLATALRPIQGLCDPTFDQDANGATVCGAVDDFGIAVVEHICCKNPVIEMVPENGRLVVDKTKTQSELIESKLTRLANSESKLTRLANSESKLTRLANSEFRGKSSSSKGTNTDKEEVVPLFPSLSGDDTPKSGGGGGSLPLSRSSSGMSSLRSAGVPTHEHLVRVVGRAETDANFSGVLTSVATVREENTKIREKKGTVDPVPPPVTQNAAPAANGEEPKGGGDASPKPKPFDSTSSAVSGVVVQVIENIITPPPHSETPFLQQTRAEKFQTVVKACQNVVRSIGITADELRCAFGGIRRILTPEEKTISKKVDALLKIKVGVGVSVEEREGIVAQIKVFMDEEKKYFATIGEGDGERLANHLNSICLNNTGAEFYGELQKKYLTTKLSAIEKDFAPRTIRSFDVTMREANNTSRIQGCPVIQISKEKFGRYDHPSGADSKGHRLSNGVYYVTGGNLEEYYQVFGGGLYRKRLTAPKETFDANGFNKIVEQGRASHDNLKKIFTDYSEQQFSSMMGFLGILPGLYGMLYDHIPASEKLERIEEIRNRNINLFNALDCDLLSHGNSAAEKKFAKKNQDELRVLKVKRQIEEMLNPIRLYKFLEDNNVSELDRKAFIARVFVGNELVACKILGKKFDSDLNGTFRKEFLNDVIKPLYKEDPRKFVTALSFLYPDSAKHILSEIISMYKDRPQLLAAALIAYYDKPDKPGKQNVITTLNKPGKPGKQNVITTLNEVYGDSLENELAKMDYGLRVYLLEEQKLLPGLSQKQKTELETKLKEQKTELETKLKEQILLGEFHQTDAGVRITIAKDVTIDLELEHETISSIIDLAMADRAATHPKTPNKITRALYDCIVDKASKSNLMFLIELKDMFTIVDSAQSNVVSMAALEAA